jgi:hypothetical protein
MNCLYVLPAHELDTRLVTTILSPAGTLHATRRRGWTTMRCLSWSRRIGGVTFQVPRPSMMRGGTLKMAHETPVTAGSRSAFPCLYRLG